MTNSIGGKNRKLRSKRALAALAGAASLLLARATNAGNGPDTWQGNTSALWSFGGNWSPATNAPPITGDSLVFGAAGSSGSTLIDDLMTPATFNVAGITFNGPGAFIINPNTPNSNGFTLTGAVTNNGTSLQTINDLIAMTAVQTFTTKTGGGNIAVGGVVSGIGGITAAGVNGTVTAPPAATGGSSLTLTGNNTFSGGTTLSGGYLYLGGASGNALGTVGTAQGSVSGSLTLAAGADDFRAGVYCLSNQTSGVINFNSSGFNYIRPNGFNWTVAGLNGGANGVVENGGFGTALATNGTLTLNVTTGNSYTYSGYLRDADAGGGTGKLSLVMSGGGTQTLLGSSYPNYTGGTTVNGGTLVLDLQSRVVYGLNIFANVINSPGTLTFNNTNTTVDATGITAGSISGSGILTKTGAGYLDFAGSSIKNFSGTINVQGGTLASNSSDWSTSVVGGDNNIVLNLSSGTNFDLRVGNVVIDKLTGLGTVGSTYVNSRVLSVGNNNGSSTFDGVIQDPLALPGAQATGTVGLTKNGTGTFTLSRANTYTGATTINGGTFALTASGFVGAKLGATPVTVTGATLAVTPGVPTSTGNNNSIGSTLTMNTGSAFTMADGFTNTFNVTGAANLYAGAAGTAPRYAFDIDITSGVNDQLAIGGAATLTNPGAVVYINPLGTLTPGNTYTLITGGTGSTLSTNGLVLATTKFTIGGSAYTGTLTNSPGSVLLTIGSVAGLDKAYWTGAGGTTWGAITGSSTNWNTSQAGGVDAGAQPTSVTDVFFTTSTPTATNLTNNTLGAPYTINSLNFTSTAGAVIIGAGSTLTINSGGITVANGAAAQTINVAVALGAPQIWTNNSAATLTVGGVVSGGFALTTVGTGTIVLSNANTYSGGTTINGGTLKLDFTSRGPGASQVTLGTIAVNSTLELYNNTAVTSSNYNTASTLPINTTFSGSGTITKTGVGIVDFFTATSLSGFTGLIDVQAGLLGDQSGSFTTGTASLNVASSAFFDLRTSNVSVNNLTGLGTIASSFNNPVTKTLTVGAPGGTSTFNGVIQNSVPTASGGTAGGVIALTKTGSGMLTLSGANTYTGATTISGGTLQLTNQSAFASAIADNATLIFNNTAGGFTMTSASTVNLQGALNYTGSTNGSYIITGGLITVNAPSTIATTGVAGNLAGLYLDGGLAGSAALTVTGNTPGVGLVFRNNNITYSGTMTVNGTASTAVGGGSGLAVGNRGTNPNMPNASLTLNGTLEMGNTGMGLAGGNIAGQTFQINALNGTGDVVSNWSSGTNTTTFSVGNNAGGGTFSGTIADGTNNTLSFTKAGIGTQTLSGGSTYSGATNINAGVLSVVFPGSLLSTGTVKVAASATLGGSGAVGNITAAASSAGLVGPGIPATPGILSAVSLDPATNGRMALAFRLTAANTNPTYATPGTSVNDALHLTGATPLVNPLTSANVVSVYLPAVGTFTVNNTFTGGVYADSLSAGALATAMAPATFSFFTQDVNGATSYDGSKYSPFTGTVTESAVTSSGSGASGGGIETFTITAVPEPTTLGLLALGSVGLLARRRRA